METIELITRILAAAPKLTELSRAEADELDGYLEMLPRNRLRLSEYRTDKDRYEQEEGRRRFLKRVLELNRERMVSQHERKEPQLPVALGDAGHATIPEATTPLSLDQQTMSNHNAVRDEDNKPKKEDWLAPGDQADQLLGPKTDNGPDQVRRLQITRKVRMRSLEAGFLAKEHVQDRGNKGQFVRSSAWQLPVAYFKAIALITEDQEKASKVFPSKKAGDDKEWYFCHRCEKIHELRQYQKQCPDCKEKDLSPLACRKT